MHYTLYDASVQLPLTPIKTIPISVIMEDLGVTRTRLERLLGFSGSLDAGTAEVQLSNDGQNFTTHATLSGLAGNASFNLIGDFLRIDGTLLGPNATCVITIS